MPNYPTAGVTLVAETQDAYDAVESLASTLDEITSGTYSVSVEADTSEAQSALDDLPLSDETVDFTVDATVTGDELPVDGETVETTVDVQETDTAKQSLDALNYLKNTKIIETVWNITGTALNLFQQFGGQILDPLIKLDDVVAKVNAATGNAIPNARTLIHDIFYSDLGESIDQVGKLITQAHQIGAPIDEAARAALTFTHAFTDQNPEQVLNTLNQLVVNKLTPDYKTASDLLTTSFQQGANRAGDLLTALNNNANAIHNLGLTGPEALSFIKTGLDNGITSANEVIRLMETIKKNVQNAAGNSNSDVSKTLRQLGIANPSETGQAWSADFFKGVINAINNAPGLSDTDKEALFSKLAGGKQGGKTFAAFLQMSPDDADTIFANVGGAAERAAKEADNSLSGAFKDFQLAVEQKVQEVLSSQAIDIPGKIKLLKEGLQNALDELAAGGSLSDALTVALKPLGLDNAFQQLESTLGNMVISLLQVAQSIQEFTGHGEQAAGTGQVVTRLAKQQLDFDLKISNPEELQSVIATAASRGLSSEDISKEISGVIQGLVKAGTKESLDQAQQIINTLKTPVDQNTLPTLASGAPMNVEPIVSDSALDNLQGQIDTAMAKVPPPEKVDAWQQSLDAMGVATNNMQEATTNAQLPIDTAAKSTDTLAQNASHVYPQTDKTADSLSNVGVQADAASVKLDGVAGSLQVVLDKANSVSQAADKVAQQQSQQANSGQAVPDQTAGPHAMGGVASAALVGEGGQEIVSSNKDFAILNNKTTQAIMGAVYAFMNGSRVASSGGGNTYVANNTNYVQSEAQADSVGYSTGRVLRGMG